MNRAFVYEKNTGTNWNDYLKITAIENTGKDVKAIRNELSLSNRNIIAGNKAISSEINSGFKEISGDLQDISQNIRELSASFEWGLSELLTEVGRVNDSLTELIKIAKTPAQTWAYEQFEIARDAFRKNLFEDSLIYLNRAIHGYGDNTGYKLEYRFHMFLGTIRLGSYKNNSKEINNLQKSEKAFKDAAKYAEHDFKNEAGRAFLAAGWSAYCQGNIEDSIYYTQKAISLYPSLGEAHFQMAKFLMHEGTPEKALSFLTDAIKIDRNYLVKSSIDGDFLHYNNELSALIDRLHNESKETALDSMLGSEKRYNKINSLRVGEYRFDKFINLDNLTIYNTSSQENYRTNYNSMSSTVSIKNLLDSAKEKYSRDTYFDYLDSLNISQRINKLLSKEKAKFLSYATNDIDTKCAKITSHITTVRDSPFQIGYIIVCVIIAFLIGVSSCSEVNSSNEHIRKKIFNEMGIFIENNGGNGGYCTSDPITGINKSKCWEWIENTMDKRSDTPYNRKDIPTDGIIWFMGWLLGGVAASVVLFPIIHRSHKRKKCLALKKKIQSLESIKKSLQKA